MAQDRQLCSGRFVSGFRNLEHVFGTSMRLVWSCGAGLCVKGFELGLSVGSESRVARSAWRDGAATCTLAC